jgi:PAS domain S-box-containing protein
MGSSGEIGSAVSGSHQTHGKSLPNITSAIRRYGLAIISVAFALLVTLVLQHYGFHNAVLSLYLLAVALTAWYEGVGPAVLSIVLSFLCYIYFFAPPIYNFAFTVADVPAVAILIVFGVMITTFSAVRRRIEGQLLHARDELRRDIDERRKTEEKLRRSEAYHAEAQRLSKTGSWAHNPNIERTIYWSEEMRRIFGLDLRKSNLPDTEEFLRLVHPDDRDRFREWIKKAVREKADFAVDYRIVLHDGAIKHIHGVGHPVLDETGNIIEYVGTDVDVTEQHEASAALQRAFEQIKGEQTELRWMTDAIASYIYVLSPDGKPLYANQTVLDYTGLSLEDLQKEDHRARILHPEEVERLREARREALARGVPFENEQRGLGKDGKYRWFLVRYNPLRDDQGHIIRWYATGTDIEDRKQAEQALRKSEERWRSVFENSAIGVALTDLSGRFLATNHVYQTMLGYTEEELRALSFLDVTHEDYHEANRALVTELLEEKRRQFQMEKKYLCKDGSSIWVRNNISLVPGTESVPRFVMALSEDITERKRAEEALRRSEAYLAEGQRLAKTGSWAYDPNIERTIYWSEESRRIFGSDPQGGYLPDAEEFFRLVHPEDRDRFRERIKKAIREKADFAIDYRIVPPDGTVKHIHTIGHPVLDDAGNVMDDFDTEYRLLLPNGTTKYIHAVGHPVMNASGDVIELVGTAMDVTEQHEASAALQAAFEQIKAEETELRMMIDAIPTFVAVLNPDGRLVHVNQTAVDYTGVTAEDTQRDSDREPKHPEDVERLREDRLKALAGDVPFENEQRLRGKDGQYRWFLVRYNPLRDDQGKIIRWYATATDIDDRKRAEERMRDENLALREQIDQAFMFEEIVGASPALQNVLSSILKVAPTDSTVLITGETGTGKELIARAIHKHSQRSSQAFISVNCAAIPSSLIASELFGHEKGAFTGALQRRLGRFELAHSGTIFLDEVGDLPAETQVTLLRVLQERQFERVGGNRILTTDVRVIAATNRDLSAAIAAGTFRSDLFYRLNVFPIEMPPLRERREDIPLLVEYFIDRYARKAGKSIRGVNKKTLDLFQSYPWPGNIRELQNIIERSVIVCETENFSVDENWLTRQPIATESKSYLDLAEKLALQEKETIEAALRDCGGQVFGPSGAAARLGMPRSTLESKIRSLKINKNRFKAEDHTRSA